MSKQEKSTIWTAKQLKYIDLLANPEENRSKEKMAEELGVDPATLYKWQNKEGFWDAVYERAMVYLNASLAQVLHSLKRQAKKGDVNAIKLILQHTGKLRKEPEQEVRVILSWDEEEEAMTSCGAS
ncbi:hypothetical protein HKBW3S43_01048 [Candidatus Hakubella thermalkaliphila]|uniref:Homeodomain phBC6A51-type domain-containing protein n=1 Tax=Candidatus Hakubella thermalkaliphila TaxID=2754717 RepID=A0A6V8P842_9ACTN|nr:phBC6A51 family helix-turn-helix protein [Candidatus Hakubella thermalkaliphila]MBT9167204.1 hypothetical protein [Bacillota bacterium]MBT9174066.1 hypothetical protein [Bacillota bacterium]GFP24786.1 hypothetical protein HKBW3S25_00223 [Candidatus Hakubella thermalkaliphila]GFP26946.1 hypothetical protein HKBW3S33_00359 [Candidatus Hakubella thermalkaliphila]GFP35256.1 hypothetical protein HKBW3S43_01048 [Candidatus Hakubella thermalkaliphila]